MKQGTGSLVKSVFETVIGMMTYPVGHREFGALLTVLVAVDLFFISAYLVTSAIGALGFESREFVRFNITWEHAMSERFNYWKWFTAAILLAAASFKTRSRVFACLSGVFLTLFADDYWRLHERIGAFLAGRLEIGAMVGLRPQDFGELMVWSALGIPVVALFGLAAVSKADPYRGHLVPFAIGVAALIVVGVGFDMAHSVVNQLTGPGGLDFLFGVLEDGGELLFGSLVCSYALAAVAGTHSAVLRLQTAPDRLFRRS